MRVEAIEARALHIPFKVAFSHASADRTSTQTVWVTACGDGHIGYGEGCPREYVTGESLRTAGAFVAEFADDWYASIRNLESLRAWSQRHTIAIDRNPAAWAAVELALLDLIAKSESKSVESFLNLPALAGRFLYTAVIGDAPLPQFAAQLAHYLKAGFRHFKIKLSGDTTRDRAKVHALGDAGLSGQSVRADANNVWQSADAAIAALQALEFRFAAIEEPLKAGDYAGMARLAFSLHTRVVLDESVLSVEQLDRLSAPAGQWIVNVRVSKMGGVLRSLELVSELHKRGLGLIIGAQVGETSILTRAALTVANASKDILLAQEGAFGTHLLARDVVESPLMFGPGGMLDVSGTVLAGAGWGLPIVVEPTDLEALPGT
ncbi:MAG: mandelate racemase/muconate lactonizing enzyme family protein [Burkholderiales bacterium]